MPGVQEVIKVSKPYKLVSRDVKQENTIIRFPWHRRHHRRTGTGHCQASTPAALRPASRPSPWLKRVHRACRAQFFRGGAYKPRTSPYSFQGLGEEGLRIMAEIRQQFGLKIITEAVDYESLDLVDEYADVIQIEMAPATCRIFLCSSAPERAKKPVLLKRGHVSHARRIPHAAAEYILSEGNYNVALCERGVRTFAGPHPQHARPQRGKPAVQRSQPSPDSRVVIPATAPASATKSSPLSRAAVAVGADGLMVEVHHKPDEALSDGPQSLLSPTSSTI